MPEKLDIMTAIELIFYRKTHPTVLICSQVVQFYLRLKTRINNVLNLHIAVSERKPAKIFQSITVLCRKHYCTVTRRHPTLCSQEKLVWISLLETRIHAT